MLEITGLKKSFNGKTVLNGVSFTFPSPGVTAITGPSGVGKTTLINLILGLQSPDDGHISGRDGLRLAAVFQEDRLIMHLSAFENVHLVAHPDVTASDIRQALAKVGLDGEDRQAVAQYSGGMKRRVAIVRAVLAYPELLVLDEPFKGLDDAAKAKCANYLRSTCTNTAVLLITHDSEDIRLMQARAVLRLD